MTSSLYAPVGQDEGAFPDVGLAGQNFHFMFINLYNVHVLKGFFLSGPVDGQHVLVLHFP
ncbi:hypothetical protein ACQ86N_18915 [Puia sp. P3]|uniref:hypothetical protein n=1 Tax=Puia sp. P3 TaxID=3423952 RepID=UPI003D67ABAF